MSRDLSLLSTTPASNDVAGGWQTGMAPSKVKNAGWADESIIAQLFNALPAGGGSANAQTLTNPVPITSLTTGLTVIYLPSAANTGATTFAPDGLTAKNIFVNGAACQGGELSATVPAWLKYDGTQWNLLNPVRYTNQDYAAAAGTNTITATIPGLTAYYDGLVIKLKLANTTTASPTVNANSIGAKNTYYMDGTTVWAAGSGIQNITYSLKYDSSLNAAVGGWLVMDPSRVLSSFSLTYATGFGTTPTVTITYSIAPDGRTAHIRCAAGNVLTSTTTGFTGTGVPAALTSTTEWRVSFPCEDSSSYAPGARLCGTNTTTWTFFNNLVSTGWTASGSKGILLGATCTYTLD